MDIDKLLKAEIAATEATEWTGTIGGETVTLYANPLTPADFDFVERKFPGFMSSPKAGGMVLLIVRRARDANGNRVFQQHHVEALSKFPADKISEIFAGLFGEQFDEIADEDGTKHEERVGN